MKSNAKELALELENVMKKIKYGYDEANREVSRIDLIRQDVLHHIENNKFNASHGYMFAKALQVISQERRILKDEYEMFQSLNDRIKGFRKDITKTTAKVIEESKQKEARRNRGHEVYQPRIIKSLDKNDVLNQVISILSENEEGIN